MSSWLDAPPHVQSVFCDDVREEVGNKFTAVGIYGTVLGMFEAQTIMPQLAVLLTLDLPLSYVGKRLQARMCDRDEELLKFDIQLERPGDAPHVKFAQRLYSAVPIRMQGFQLKDSMELFLTVTGEDLSYRSSGLAVAHTGGRR